MLDTMQATKHLPGTLDERNILGFQTIHVRYLKLKLPPILKDNR